jgi:hypothetical protein
MADHYLSIGKDGERLPLPANFDAAEFLLPCNSAEVKINTGYVYAVYDETTQTGAIWASSPHPRWTMFQPILRDDFFLELVPSFALNVEAFNLQTLSDKFAKIAEKFGPGGNPGNNSMLA